MAFIIDRRKNGKNKSSENRLKFLRRYKKSITDAVKRGVANRNISDVNKKGVDITVKRKDITEPRFSQDYRTGIRQGVNVGNTKYREGDKIKKPPQSPQEAGGAGDGGDGEDEFSFSISKEEFMQYFFDDLELPNLIHKNIDGSTEYKWDPSGISTSGSPCNLDLVRTMKSALGRKFALNGSANTQIRELQEELDALLAIKPTKRTIAMTNRIAEIPLLIEEIQRKRLDMPKLGEFDLRYRTHEKTPVPSHNAVMFCLMDVSGSMGEHEKDLAKRFYILMYLFLSSRYERVDVRYIRHHHDAHEVSEDEFFHSRESGGTIVSNVMFEMLDIIKQEYSESNWNIYVAQTSDGDNWPNDVPLLQKTVDSLVLPKIQHFTYLEVGDESGWRNKDGYVSSVWSTYETFRHRWVNKFDMKKITQLNEVGDVFRELFKKRTA